MNIYTIRRMIEKEIDSILSERNWNIHFANNDIRQNQLTFLTGREFTLYKLFYEIETKHRKSEDDELKTITNDLILEIMKEDTENENDTTKTNQ